MENPNIQARISVKTLAWLALFWNNRGQLPATRGELVNKTLQAFINIASHQNPDIKPPEDLSYEESVQVLTACSLGIPEQKAARIAIMRQLQGETLQRDFDEALPKEIVRKHIKEKDSELPLEQPVTKDGFDEEAATKKQQERDEAVKAATASGMIGVKDANRSGQRTSEAIPEGERGED